MAAQKPNFFAYAAPIDNRSTKPWRLIGAAWDNNGYISVVLDAYPAAGNRLVLAPPKTAEELERPTQSESRQNGTSSGGRRRDQDPR